MAEPRAKAQRQGSARVSYPNGTPPDGAFVAPEMMTLLVVRLSQSFGELWSEMSLGLGLDMRVVGEDEVGTVGPDVAMVLVAAGGSEREAIDWLNGRDLPVAIPVFVVGADAGRRLATQIVGHGAADYFALPEDLEVLQNTTQAVADRQREQRRRSLGVLDEVKPEAFGQIIGESAALRALLARAARLLPHAHASALIVGETGTGKELVARAIHDGGHRRSAPFVAVNCSALPQHLVESELFGHEKGAFTDAHAAKPGLFEVAEGGTLFFDEVGTLPLDLQAKLLRVLEDKMVRRVGGTKWRRANVRVLAATNDRLETRVEDGSFRQDLYFRLGVVTLELPPLRQRENDVVLIAQELLRRTARQHDLPIPVLEASAKAALLAQPWAGNVRELKNAIERALLLSTPGELDLSELIPQAPRSTMAYAVLPFPARLDDIITTAAEATLESCNGNRSEAARRLGISRRRLRRLTTLRDSEEPGSWADSTRLRRSDPDHVRTALIPNQFYTKDLRVVPLSGTLDAPSGTWTGPRALQLPRGDSRKPRSPWRGRRLWTAEDY